MDDKHLDDEVFEPFVEYTHQCDTNTDEISLKIENDYIVALNRSKSETVQGEYSEFVLSEFDDDSNIFGWLKFQNGPYSEVGKNGVSDEALLELLIFRLEVFQKHLPCQENERCLEHLRSAVLELRQRTRNRRRRGVEGTMKP